MPRWGRQALFGFAMLAAGVAYNALFLQTRPASGTAVLSDGVLTPVPNAGAAQRTATIAYAERIPAPGWNDRGSHSVRDRPDLVQTALPVAQHAPAAGEVAGVDTIRAIQRELRQRGYGTLLVDGAMRPMTRAAIMAYEYDNGLPLTGQASEALLKRILLGGTTPQSEPGTQVKVRTAEAEQIVKTVQQSLSAKGYRPGPADGHLGEDTVRAIREFEMDKGVVPKGRISADLVAQLAEARNPPKR